ncbi:hypothetical protein A2714_04150 [Candidatus Woesebacteria bacterium RIFCSPHIGHO2_01_FULL_38_9]|uniref:dolichyl-phosphate beta-glucosyltransferase n=2 Tax=Candidatus Woeseibacteriota TaxID=1752722 RepID=A0A1F7Y3N2_9BACT|nr:MAG: hypothetical protein A2714_04150 [Candidatus Woesebacteria bacterium RIFCSPHIGHO2_01_FULL_38_9]OGM60571.1 MAG: hypothetical protein A3A75_03540 [Candidatus Woesebacteria bacterium RIFCSPLOWO2_01_FULL_39_10]
MKNKGPTFLSVIIPVYNESKRVYKLTKILKYLGRNTFRTEIIVVNDGSKDNTLLKLKNLTSKKLQKNLNVKIISYRKNKGKGYAIKKGVLKARGKHRLFLDIDLSTPISEFQKFLTHLGKYDILIGSRKIKGAKVSQRQSLIREALGKNFTFLSQIILGLKVSDFTCGFKCFSTTASQTIFKLQRIDRWGFDCEILFIAKQLGFTIKEVPVIWKNDPNSKVRFPHDIISSFLELLKIRINYFSGKYRL